MEHGKIKLNKPAQDKNVSLKLVLSNGREIPISDGRWRNKKLWEDIDEGEHDVEYELQGGQPIKIKIGEQIKERPEAQAQPVKQQQPRHGYPQDRKPAFGTQYGGTGSNQGRAPQPQAPLDGATAPYNFVPLNDIVVSIDKDSLPPFDQQQGLDGYIDLELEALSPLYIRQTYTEEELKKLEELEAKVNAAKNDEVKKKQAEKELLDYKFTLNEFYRPVGGKYRIPGSSLRGMIRSLYEVVSYSKMTIIDDHKLYYRSFADVSEELKNNYQTRMIQRNDNGYSPKVLPGYLKREGNDYYIYVANSYHRVEEDMVVRNGIVRERMATFTNDKYRKNDRYQDYIRNNPFKVVYYKADPLRGHPHSEPMEYSKVTDILPGNANPPAGYQKGYLVLSGWIPSQRAGKHMHWVISEITEQRYKVPASLIRDYEKDYNRTAIDMLKHLKANQPFPCFYIVENNEVKAFGHTGMFRMVYDKSIGDLIKQSQKPNSLDLAEAVFGYMDGNYVRPGRVYFEDLICTEAKKMPAAQHPKILSGPKPSTFQHYLAQDASRISRTGKAGKNRQGINNYNTEGARLAGNKFYWHRDHKDWSAGERVDEKMEKQYTKIKPLDVGSCFKGRIRFQNLSEVELGALLMVINLPEGCHHRLGMGKPLGLGSVKINGKLKLIDRKARYSGLAESGVSEKTDTSKYLNALREHLNSLLNENSADLWSRKRMNELRCMLNYQNKPDNQTTRYMEIERAGIGNEYRSRPILKKPSQTIARQ